ncbi:MAG: hypothetical protein M3Z35_09345 [Nitrospirota bacterium]|nr:hypothetical protein [Nitrospirota bacterium]
MSAAQERIVNETPTTITESATVVERPSVAEVPATAPPAVGELPISSTPSVHPSPHKTESFIEQAKISGPPVVEFWPTKELPSQRRPAVKADFGWLS